MNKREIIAALTPWAAHYAAINAAYEPLAEALRLGPENPIFDALWRGFDAHTDTLAQLVGDGDEWLCWFAHENEMGAKKHEASVKGGKMRKICSLADLARVIVESR